MSGGVDSSVAAKILKDQGHDLIGIFLNFWKENDEANIESWGDAQRVCARIGISLYTLNFSNEFKNIVVGNFLSEYRHARTPNPCVICNKRIKLGLLIKKAEDLGYDHIATGHYALKKNSKSGERLYRAKDDTRDQSYFLYTLNQSELKHLIFPLGGFLKSEIRQMAKKFKLPTADKKESREICFISEKSHNEFLKRNIKLKSGPIKTLDGKTIGRHQGLPLYTIGQRKGVEIGGIGPFYVSKCDRQKNILWVANKVDDASIYKSDLTAEQFNWISGQAPKLPLKAQAVIRYRHKPIDCIIAADRKNYKITFKEPQRAITPGQSVVLYQKNEVLGGGIIN